MGASVLWSTAFFYIAKVGQKHACETGKKPGEVTGTFFGRFSATQSSAILVGTLLMSFLIEALGGSDNQMIEANINTTLAPSPANATSVYNNTDDVVCGLYYKFNDAPPAKKVSDVVMYVLLSAYLCFNLIAVGLCFCLDEITDPVAILLMPLTLHYGIIQGFVRGIFNASWIACALDIKYMSYATAIYGGTMIIACYGFGKLLKFTTHMKIFLVTVIAEVGLFIVT
uniref:Uncharacterized protein n=1 Tax=Ciona savignyi TaxID=51511 RepID=H2ZC52_CIOSA